MKTSLLLISMTNLTDRVHAEQARGSIRQNTMAQMCAHIFLYRRFEYGSEPTPEELAAEQLRARLDRIEQAAAARPPRRRAHHPNPIIFGNLV